MRARAHATKSTTATPSPPHVQSKASTETPPLAHTKKPGTFDKIVRLIGYIASVLAVIMYVSYIPQIADNLAGHPGNPVQPFAAMLNCIMWSAYGLLQKRKDWPIVIANVPGVFLAATAFATALMGS